MSPSLSVYLDLIRLGAALVVVLHHAWPILVPAHPLPWPGTQAVIVFFVLSGYVIAYVADGREKMLSDYIVRRVTRVWSVAIPALVLAAILTPLVGTTTVSDAAPPAASGADLVVRSAMNLIFLGQLWHLDVTPPLNGPFWSLNYEVWYYALFGVWTYLRGWRRIILLVVVAAISGPKILLLLPCWLAGVWLYRHRPALPLWVALALFFGTIIAYSFLFKFGLPIRIRDHMIAMWPGFMRDLSGSNEFVGDYLITLLVAGNFAAVANLGRYGGWLLAIRRPASAAAAYTFSIYLYHMPLLALLCGGLQLPAALSVVLLIVTITIMGRMTERNLPRFRNVFRRLVGLAPG